MSREPFGLWSDNSGPFLWFWIIMFSAALAAALVAIAMTG